MTSGAKDSSKKSKVKHSASKQSHKVQKKKKSKIKPVQSKTLVASADESISIPVEGSLNLDVVTETVEDEKEVDQVAINDFLASLNIEMEVETEDTAPMTKTDAP